MRLALVAVALASLASIAGTAAADPMKPRCNVEILRAPTEVRTSIAAWLEGEQQCSVSLTVRVIKTEGGYYILAHAPDGRVYETTVIDAELVAEAVTRWAANRSSAIAPMTPTPPPASIPPQPTPPPTAPATLETPLSPADARVDGGAMPRRDDTRWFAAGGIVGDQLYGLRGEIDLWAKQRFALGAALELSAMTMSRTLPAQSYELGFQDIRALATGSRTWGSEKIQLRAQVAVGLNRSNVTGSTQSAGAIDASDWFVTADANLQVLAMVGDRWALALGPQLTVYSAEFRTISSDMTLVRRDYAVSAFAALRRKM